MQTQLNQPLSVATFWQAYLATLPADSLVAHQPIPEAWSFGDNPQLADELVALVCAGVKTATCSALWEHEADGEPLPQVGALSIILDGRRQPRCIIETTEVQIKPYNQVDAQFAAAEGEGDRSLAYWRAAHWRFFSRTFQAIKRTPTKTMLLVCERFRVLFQV